MIRSETLIPLTGGAYSARNAIADYQICENLFPEINPEVEIPAAPATHYPREGLRPLSTPPSGGVGRGIFTLSNGQLYAIVGANVYYISPTWSYVPVGSVSSLYTPVKMRDNGVNAVIVDGQNGYTVNMTTRALAQIIDPTGTFIGASSVDYCDTYFAFSTPGTNQWMVTDPNSVTFNALQVANKSSNPDPIVALAYNLRVAWLIGAQTTECWYLAGSTPFPYQAWPNVFVPFGCAATYSIVQADIDLFWLSRNEQGQAIAVKTKGYGVEAISTRALEYEWSKYSGVADCVVGTFQQAGHTFIVYHFPSANASWGYDLSTKQWHKRVYTDANGVANREKVSFYASVGSQGGYPTTIVGQDWNTGQIYALDPQVYDDNGQPIVCRRSFPHQVKDLKEVTVTSFVADFATGGATGTESSVTNLGPITGPALCMRYSRDGGSTWSNYRQKGLAGAGNYRSMMRFRGLGMARDWVFELLFVYPGPTALQGAYIEVVEHSA